MSGGPWELGASTLGAPDETLSAIVSTMDEFGARYVELRAADGAQVHCGLSRSERAAVRDLFAGAGIAVVAVASRVRAAAPGPDDEVVEALAAHLRLAADLGAPFVRIFPGAPVEQTPPDRVPVPVGDAAVAEEAAARRLTAVARLAADLGVWPVLETHDSHPSGVDIARLLSRVDTAATDHRIGAVWDMLHPWRVGEDPDTTWAALRPYIVDGRGYVQIKDVAAGTDVKPVLPGSGVLPVPAIAAVLGAGGYRGPLSLEWERYWHPDIPPFAEALAAAARVVAALPHR